MHCGVKVINVDFQVVIFNRLSSNQIVSRHLVACADGEALLKFFDSFKFMFNIAVGVKLKKLSITST